MKSLAIIAAVVAVASGSVISRATPTCPNGQLICGFELRQWYTQEQLEQFVRNSQAPPTQENVDGLYQCTTTDPIWLHACNNATGQPAQGQCVGRDVNPPDAFCRFGP